MINSFIITFLSKLFLCSLLFQACEICGEPFEQFWDEDEEEWHLKDALRIKERTYHPVCYEDFKEVWARSMAAA